MRKVKKNKEGNKNIRLGIYFGIVVIFIILVSFTFKIFDSVKKSTFDAGNFYTVAVFTDKNSHLISVSPKENSLKELVLEGVNSEESLKSLGIPYDNKATWGKETPINPQSYFTKMLFRQDDLRSNLTLIDLIKLSVYAKKVSGENISKESVSAKSEDSGKIISSWFLDPEIVEEEIKIEIVNTTGVSGLGQKFAELITNAGGSVVLVHSSQEELDKSIIYFENDSYSAGKLSKLLDLPKEKKELNTVSDIVIQLGEDSVD